MVSELDNLKIKIEQQLKEDNPDLTSEEIKVKSKKIIEQYKEEVSENLDEEGRIIVGENVKFNIDCQINSIEE